MDNVKKNYSCEILKFEIDLNDSGEFVNNNIKSNNVSVPKTIQKANCQHNCGQ